MAIKSAFTTEMIAKMVAVYNPKGTDKERRAQVASLAKGFDMSARQVIGKISTLGDVLPYTPYAAKAPKARKATNQELVNTLSEQTGIEVDVLQSLERSSKAALLALVAYTAPVETEAEAEAQDETSGD